MRSIIRLLRATLNFVPSQIVSTENPESCEAGVGLITTRGKEVNESSTMVLDPEILHRTQGPESLNWWGIRREPALFDVITKMYETVKRRLEVPRGDTKLEAFGNTAKNIELQKILRVGVMLMIMKVLNV